MDLLKSIQFLDQNWDDCIKDKDISDAINNNNPFDSLQNFENSETFKSANRFFETFSQNKKTTSLIALVSNISSNFQEVTDIYDQFLSIDFNLTINKNKNTDNEKKIKSINEAQYFLTQLYPLFSSKFHKKDFDFGNNDEKNYNYLEKLNMMRILINKFPDLYNLYPDLQIFPKTFEIALNRNSDIIINSFTEELNNDKVQKIKKYFNYHKELISYEQLDVKTKKLDKIRGFSTYMYVKSMIANKLKSNTKIPFNYRDDIVYNILQMIPKSLPENINLSMMPEEIQFVYFIVNLPTISQNKIKNLDSIFGKGLRSTFYDAIKKYFTLSDKNISPFGKNFILFDEYFQKNFEKKMSANFIFSVFSNPQKFEELNSRNQDYMKIIQEIRKTSLQYSNAYFDSCFNEPDKLIEKCKNTIINFVRAGDDLSLILDKKFKSIKFPQNNANIDKMRSDQESYICSYIKCFKSIRPFLEQISLYKLNQMPDNKWSTFLNRCENLEFIKRIDSIHSFFDQFVLLFYAMVNHYLIILKNDQKAFLTNNFQTFVHTKLINSNSNENNNFASLSYQNLIDSAFTFIIANANKVAPLIKSYLNVNEDVAIFNIPFKQFVYFFTETLLEYLYKIYPPDDYPKLREDLMNKLLENGYLARLKKK